VQELLFLARVLATPARMLDLAPGPQDTTAHVEHVVLDVDDGLGVELHLLEQLIGPVHAVAQQLSVARLAIRRMAIAGLTVAGSAVGLDDLFDQLAAVLEHGVETPEMALGALQIVIARGR